MTTPNDPHDGQSPNDSFGDLPRYEPTSHPEDNPNFGSPNPGGQQAPGYGYAGAQGYVGGNDGYLHGPQRPQAVRSIGWGFSAFGRNWKTLVPLALVLGLAGAILSIGISLLTGGDIEAGYSGNSVVTSLLSLVISIVVTPVLYRFATWHVDDPRPGIGALGKDVHWAAAGVYLVVQGIITVIMLGGMQLSGFNEMSNTTDPAQLDPSFFAGVFAFFMAFVLLMFFLSPLFTLMPWFAADGKTGFGASFSTGFAAGKKNYLQLLLFSLLVGLISFGLMLAVALVSLLFISFGIVGVILMSIFIMLGASIVAAVVLLAQAHMYRSCAATVRV